MPMGSYGMMPQPEQSYVGIVVGLVVLVALLGIVYYVYTQKAAELNPYTVSQSAGIPRTYVPPGPPPPSYVPTSQPQPAATPARLRILPDQWNPVSISPGIGGLGGVEAASQQCPTTEWINSMYGRSGSYVDKIGFKCTDGTDLGSIGGEGGVPFEYSNDTGIAAIIAHSGDAVDRVQAKWGNGGTSLSAGGLGGSLHNLSCPAGKVAVGFGGRSGSKVDQLTLICNTAPSWQ